LGYTLGVFFHELIWSPCSGEKKEGKKVVACFAFRQSGMETKDAKMFFFASGVHFAVCVEREIFVGQNNLLCTT
jgi:hypothetical protein